MSKIDWKDSEQVRAYKNQYRRQYNFRKKTKNRREEGNLGGRKIPTLFRNSRNDTFYDIANSTENVLYEELDFGIETERIRKEYKA